MNERPSGSSGIQSRSDENNNLDEFMISFVSSKANRGLCCRWNCWLVILLSLADIHIQLTIIKFKVYRAPSSNPSPFGTGTALLNPTTLAPSLVPSALDLHPSILWLANQSKQVSLTVMISDDQIGQWPPDDHSSYFLYRVKNIQK